MGKKRVIHERNLLGPLATSSIRGEGMRIVRELPATPEKRSSGHQGGQISLTRSFQREHVLKKTILGLASLATLLTCPEVVHAEPSDLAPEAGHNYGEHETPRMTALGGAMRATSNSLSALYSNPANMAAAQVYHVGALAQIYPEANRQSYGGAVVDSLISSTGLAGGLGGVWTLQDPDGMRREWMDLRFGMAMPLGQMFFLGLTGKYVTVRQTGTGPLGFSEVSGGLVDSNIIQTVTFDVGATIRPVPEFSIGITGTNLGNTDSAILPVIGGVGMGYGTKDFSLSADAVLESRTFGQSNIRVNGGGEVLVADLVFLRAGYRFDQGLESNAISGGLGYVNQKFGIDASVRRAVTGPSYTAIVFGFTVHIESLGLGPSSPDSY